MNRWGILLFILYQRWWIVTVRPNTDYPQQQNLASTPGHKVLLLHPLSIPPQPPLPNSATTMEAPTSCRTLHTAQILHALPITTSSFLLGFEAHSFWYPRMHAFRLCMAHRTATKHRLALPEELIRTIEEYVQAAATVHGIRYSRDFFCRVAGTRAKATTEQEARDLLEASHGNLDFLAFLRSEKPCEGKEDLRQPEKEQAVPGLVRPFFSYGSFLLPFQMRNPAGSPQPGETQSLMIYNPQAQRYLAAVFNLAIIPSRSAGRFYPKHLYLCTPWWPVPRGALDLQRWHEQKTAATEPSDLFAYFGWDRKLSPEVMTADDARAVGPSKEDVARLNYAVCALNLEVERKKGTGESAAERTKFADYIEDRRTGRKFWKPSRLLFSPVVAPRVRTVKSLSHRMQSI